MKVIGRNDMTNNNNHIIKLFRFFEEKDHADQFLKGHIRFSRQSYYSEIEAKMIASSSSDKNRINISPLKYDPYECANGSYIPYEELKKGPVHIDGKTITFNMENAAFSNYWSTIQNDNIYICCFYEAHLSIYKNRTFFHPSPRIDELGNYYIVINDEKRFFTLVAEKLKENNAKAIVGSIDYFDRSNSNKLNPYKKNDVLSWQQEFRLCFIQEGYANPFYLDIPDIKNICVLGETKDLLKSNE